MLGKVLVTAKIQNLGDLYKTKLGLLPAEQVGLASLDGNWSYDLPPREPKDSFSPGLFGSEQHWIASFEATQRWILPNPFEEKLLMDCIAAHTQPPRTPLRFPENRHSEKVPL